MSIKDKIVRTDDGRRISEHRYIMERIMGKVLKSNEVVHHINGNHYDNRPENLRLMSRVEHSRLHGKMPKNRTRVKNNIIVKPVSIKDEKERDIIAYLDAYGYSNNFSYYVKGLIRKYMEEKIQNSQPQTENKTSKKSLDFGM